VIHRLHDLDFSPQQLDVIALDVALLDALDRVTLIGALLGALHHHTESTAANFAPKLVVEPHILMARSLLVNCAANKT
jgi:hypothetical protein